MDIGFTDTPKEERICNKRVSNNRNSAFLYMCMAFYWLQNELQFHVNLKPNQLLKYLNKASIHTNSFFSFIPHSAIWGLNTLISLTQENKSTRINALYPKHVDALERAGLITLAKITHSKNLPT